MDDSKIRVGQQSEYWRATTFGLLLLRSPHGGELRGLLLEAHSLSIDRAELLSIVRGTIFVFSGLLACVIAVVRGWGGVLILVWFGIFNLTYGRRILCGRSGDGCKCNCCCY